MGAFRIVSMVVQVSICAFSAVLTLFDLVCCAAAPGPVQRYCGKRVCEAYRRGPCVDRWCSCCPCHGESGQADARRRRQESACARKVVFVLFGGGLYW